MSEVKEKERERRFVRMMVRHRDLLDVLAGRAVVNHSPLPDDATIEAVHYDLERNCLAVCLWSSRFDIVLEGECIPVADESMLPLKDVRYEPLA